MKKREDRRARTLKVIIRRIYQVRINVDFAHRWGGALFCPTHCFLHGEEFWSGPPTISYAPYDLITSYTWACFSPGHFRKAFPTGKWGREKHGKGKNRGAPRRKNFNFNAREGIYKTRRLMQEFCRGIITGRLDLYDTIADR